MDTLYHARNWFASAPSVFVLLAAILLTAIHTPHPIKRTSDSTPIRISLAAPPQAQPTPPPPMPELAPLPEVTPDIALPAMPKLAQRATPKPTPSPTPQPQIPTEASASSEPVAAAVPRPAAPAAPAAASQDDVYSAQLRAYLETIKHYPTSKEARLQRPRGTVEVWFVLDRSGGMKEAGVEDSSGSLILDGAALSLVRGASYPAFPPDAFKSEATHRFTVHLNYTLT